MILFDMYLKRILHLLVWQAQTTTSTSTNKLKKNKVIFLGFKTLL